MRKHKISAVIIVLNEERIIQKTLKAALWCDEIIVVDSGSTDKTIQICESMGAKVYQRPFDGFGSQKNFGISKATHEWVLSIDADEIITPNLSEEIQNILEQENIEETGFNIPITLIFLNSVFRHGRENKMPHLRLFNKNYGQFNDKDVHEGIELTPRKINTLKYDILHDSYTSLENYFQKFNSYTSKGARLAFRSNKKYSKLMIIIKLPISFFQFYFLQRNYLNGFPGFVWSLLSAFYPVIKYLKVYELHLKKN